MIDPKLMRNSAGQYRTDDLFWETSDKERRIIRPPLYTLKETTDKGLPSAYQIYMSCTDEYEAAEKLVGSQRHWRKLCKLKWFMHGNECISFDGLAVWREEMVQRDVSNAKKALLQAAKDGDMGAVKKLLDVALGGSAAKRTVGRPKKESKPQDAGRLAKIEQLHKRLKG